jgi:hypothetical protein
MAKHRWSQQVTNARDAFDFEKGGFVQTDPKTIARSLRASADSVLTFFIKRGKSPAYRKRALDEAREELRRAFERD